MGAQLVGGSDIEAVETLPSSVAASQCGMK